MVWMVAHSYKAQIDPAAPSDTANCPDTAFEEIRPEPLTSLGASPNRTSVSLPKVALLQRVPRGAAADLRDISRLAGTNRAQLTDVLPAGQELFGNTYCAQNDKFVSRTVVGPADSENMARNTPLGFGLAGATN